MTAQRERGGRERERERGERVRGNRRSLAAYHDDSNLANVSRRRGSVVVTSPPSPLRSAGQWDGPTASGAIWIWAGRLGAAPRGAPWQSTPAKLGGVTVEREYHDRLPGREGARASGQLASHNLGRHQHQVNVDRWGGADRQRQQGEGRWARVGGLRGGADGRARAVWVALVGLPKCCWKKLVFVRTRRDTGPCSRAAAAASFWAVRGAGSPVSKPTR